MALERLSIDDIRSRTPIAVEHLHRYELAGALCSGLRVADVCCGSGYGAVVLLDSGATAVKGVDNDQATVATALKTRGSRVGLDFEHADAVAFLERDLQDAFDAVVMFEGIEHLANPEPALAALRAHAARGIRCAVSIPNSKALREDNPFHVTDYGFDDGREALASLGGQVAFLYQYMAEGSLIRGERGGGLEGRFVLDGHGEPELCDHIIGLVNFGDDAVSRACGAHMQLAAAPYNRRYVRDLERTNEELWDQLTGLEASLSWRVTAPLRSAKRSLGRGRISDGDA